MKLKKTSIITIIILQILVSSCNSIKLNNLTNEQDLNRKIENVNIISEKEKISHSGKMIGDFIFKDNKNPDWTYLKNKMTDFAKLNGANLIEVKTLGFGKKGNVFYLEGNLYYLENVKELVLNSNPEKCAIVILRDGMEAPLGTLSKINATINNTKFDNLKKTTYFMQYIDNCEQENDVLINDDLYKVKLNGKTKYFKAAKQTSGGYLGNSVQIGIGGVYFVEIDPILGKLLLNEVK